MPVNWWAHSGSWYCYFCSTMCNILIQHWFNLAQRIVLCRRVIFFRYLNVLTFCTSTLIWHCIRDTLQNQDCMLMLAELFVPDLFHSRICCHCLRFFSRLRSVLTFRGSSFCEIILMFSCFSRRFFFQVIPFLMMFEKICGFRRCRRFL